MPLALSASAQDTYEFIEINCYRFGAIFGGAPLCSLWHAAGQLRHQSAHHVQESLACDQPYNVEYLVSDLSHPSPPIPQHTHITTTTTLLKSSLPAFGVLCPIDRFGGGHRGDVAPDKPDCLGYVNCCQTSRAQILQTV